MPDLIPETTLPNGLKIFSQNKEEVDIVYKQILSYFKNGIELQEGDTVFDVGANIGLFTVFVDRLCKNNANIYAFEPIPATFEVLQRNVQRFNPGKIKLFPCGISHNSQTRTFAYHPNCTVLSTLYPDESTEVRDLMKKLGIEKIKSDPSSIPSSIRWLRWLPPFLRSLIIEKKVEKAFQMEQVTCQLRTVSEIIREQNIQQIDLLKVDVERSELDVLLGIEDRDWQKIKQIVVEVHDLDSRVEKITALLKEHGLSKITAEQEPEFEGSSISTIYALR